MEKLNLDETWRLCLKMWKWVVKQRRSGRKDNIDSLKEEWCDENHYQEIILSCFFCEYDKRYGNQCFSCPARRIEKDFKCHGAVAIHYFFNPEEFYKNLLRLNKIRLAKKK